MPPLQRPLILDSKLFGYTNKERGHPYKFQLSNLWLFTTIINKELMKLYEFGFSDFGEFCL